MATIHYGTSDAREVTGEQFKQVCALLDQAQLTFAKAREPGLTLAQKLQLRRQAQALRDTAMHVGAVMPKQRGNET
jgi:hypothetical protein